MPKDCSDLCAKNTIKAKRPKGIRGKPYKTHLKEDKLVLVAVQNPLASFHPCRWGEGLRAFMTSEAMLERYVPANVFLPVDAIVSKKLCFNKP